MSTEIAPAPSASPVFVVGSPRSGTSMLAHLLISAGYSGFREGNFLGLLRHIERLLGNYFNWFGTDNPEVLMSRIDREELLADIAELFRRRLEKEHPIAPWFDKSGNPEVIELIPTLVQMWPSARFVFAKRRSIENIVSRLKKFPEHPFEYHCRDWAKNMSAWRAVRAALPDLACIEVEQQDMVKHPAVVAAELGELLGLPPDRQAGLIKIMGSERPQQTTAGSTERVMSLASTGWSPADVDLFLTHCKAEMDAFGYTLDETYSV
jgi:hypothetical protein